MKQPMLLAVSLLAFSTLTSLPASANALIAEATDRDWRQTTIDDLHFIRAVLRENHAGPLNRADEAFQKRFKEGFNEAKALAERATDYAGYYYAIQRYMVNFGDGHLGALGEDPYAEDRLESQWPGFVTRYRDGHFFVEHLSRSPSDAVPRSARLIGCDGMTASALAEAKIGKFEGLWSIESKRAFLSPLLLIDRGNPFVDRPSQCEFEIDGTRVMRALSYTEMDSELVHEAGLLESGKSPPFDVVEFQSGHFRISMPTFAIRNEAEAEAAQGLIDRVEQLSDRLKGAESILFDVRGNGGGSSSVGHAVLTAIWGETRIAEIESKSEAFWRLSRGNISMIERFNLPRVVRLHGENSQEAKYYQKQIAEMTAALQEGDLYYSSNGLDFEGFSRNQHSARATIDVSPTLYFLTDEQCFSACLDFADYVLNGLKAIHVGRQTSADTPYIDNRSEWLPSGLGRVGFSMKVWMGRDRGFNESYSPIHAWEGDISDTPALERWVLELHH